MRLIDADALVKELSDKYIVPVDEAASGVAAFMGIQTRQVINNAPTVDAEPTRHGRWKAAGMGDYMCSWCAEWVSGNRYHYCPNCGAKMDESEAEE